MKNSKQKKSKLKPWTPADIKQLRQLAKQKLSARVIAAKLKRSPGAVSQKAMRMSVRFKSLSR
jgi:IS30 family transposase